MTKLNRTLGLRECIFFGVGSILGAGIYALMGEIMGTLLGIMISFNGIISGATVALGFAGYFSTLIKIPLLISALSIIVLIFLINISGIKKISKTNIVFTIIEIAGLLPVIYTSYHFIGDVNYIELPAKGLNGLLLASALSFYAYIGFEDIVKLAEETKNPKKNISRALLSANIIVAIVYCVIAICAISVIPWEELAKSKSPLGDVVGKEPGNTGIIVISCIALFSTSNTILSNMLSSSRVILEMSGEISFFKKLSQVSAKSKTPVSALIFVCIVMCIFTFIGKIEIAALIANLLIFLTFLMINISVIILRVKQKNLKRPFRITWNIKNIPVVTSLIGIFMTLLLMGYAVYGLTII